VVPAARVGLDLQQLDISNVERAICGKTAFPPFCCRFEFCMGSFVWRKKLPNNAKVLIIGYMWLCYYKLGIYWAYNSDK